MQNDKNPHPQPMTGINERSDRKRVSINCMLRNHTYFILYNLKIGGEFVVL